MPGPKRTAPVIKLLRGTHRRDRDGARPAQQIDEPVNLVAPDWLTSSQREVWAFVVANTAPGVLRLIDAGVLAVYAVACDLHKQAAEKVNTEGAVTDGAVSAYQRICDKQATVVLQAAAALGIGRSAKASSGVNPFEHNGRRPPAA